MQKWRIGGRGGWVMGILLSWLGWCGGVMAEDYWVYFGTYTDAVSRGIYVARFDSETGSVGEVSLAVETEQPSFVALHPSGRYLVAVNETVGDSEDRAGGLTSFSIHRENGALSPLSRVSSRGGAPCHLVISPDGSSVLVANYVGGNVASYRMNEKGELSEAISVIDHQGTGPDASRQESPHAHSINLDPQGRYAIAADLGIDKLEVHAFDSASSKLQSRPDAAVSLPPGSGPRHFAFHPDGKHAFVINEMTSTLAVLAWDAERGTFSVEQVESTLPGGKEVPGNSTAEVVVHPSGNWVYGSNRGHDSIAVFRWDAAKGRVSPEAHVKTGGKTPRNFAVDPTGQFLFAANQGSDSVTIFRIDPQSGELRETSRLAVPRPACVRFLPLASGNE